MKTRLTLVVNIGLCVLITPAAAQVVWNGAGDYRLTLAAGVPRSFTIGGSYATGSALNVRGDLMGTPTGEVFRTDAPGGSQTTWRLFNGGVQYGALFNNGTDLHFEQEAVTKGGHLRWRTNFSTLYMQLLGLQFSTINGYSIDPTCTSSADQVFHQG